MLKKTLCLVTLLFTCSTLAVADNCGSAAGNTIIGKVTLNCQNITGSANLTATTMQGKLGVIGDLNANQANLNSIDVVGNVLLQNTTVNGTTHIVGKLEASTTIFKDTIQMDSLSATFNNSTTQGIEINSSRQNQNAFVYLNDNTIVNGNITFTNGNGVVQSHNSKINGKVIGGKITE
jgi:hypothetical protein